MLKHGHTELVTRMSAVAATASERLVPQPLRGVVDRTLVDVVCATNGGIVPVAEQLRVDIPALDAWRTVGVPTEFRGKLTAMAMLPPMPALPNLPSLPGRRVAA